MNSCAIADCGDQVHAMGLCAHHYWRKYNTGNPLTPVHRKRAMGELAENLFYSACIRNSREVVRPEEYHSPYDIEVDGWRIDVKASRINQHSGSWQFRLNTHGARSPLIDAFVLYLEIPLATPLWMFFPSHKVKAKTLSISMDRLLCGAEIVEWRAAYLDLLSGRLPGPQSSIRAASDHAADLVLSGSVR